MVDDIEAWIAKQFTGLGVATRTASAPAHPGEPFMSMDDAKDIVRKAFALCATAPTMAGATKEQVVASLRVRESMDHDDVSGRAADMLEGAAPDPALTAALAEVKRLRGSLSRISAIADPLQHSGPSATKISEIRVIVRAALIQ